MFLAGLLERLDPMQHDLLARTEAAAMWQARAEMLAGELADARGRLAVLEAPKEEMERLQRSQAFTVDQTAPPPPPPRRGWYQRLLFG